MHIFRIFYVQIRKRDADLFGSDDLPIPPSCLITVFAEQAEDTEQDIYREKSIPLTALWSPAFSNHG